MGALLSTHCKYDYDVIVVGAGSAGLTAAAFASKINARVLLVERRRVGGDCTWSGCVPSKALISISHAHHNYTHNPAGSNMPPDISAIAAKVETIIHQVYEEEAPHRLSSDGIDIEFGEIAFLDAHHAEILPKIDEAAAVSAKAAAAAAAAAQSTPTSSSHTQNRANRCTSPTSSKLFPSTKAVQHTQPQQQQQNNNSNNNAKVNAGRRKISFHACVICTGSSPLIPAPTALPGLASARFFTSETVFSVSRPFKRLCVIGGGPIGCELAQAHARLGAQVSIITGTAGLLSRDHPHARSAVLAAFKTDNIKVLHGRATRVKHALLAQSATPEHEPYEITVSMVKDGNESSSTVVCDDILVAVGRKATVPDTVRTVLGVEVDGKSGGIVVDGALRTTTRGATAAHVFAAGDCVANGPQFTHVAGFQGYVAVRNALLPGKTDASRVLQIAEVPRVTFTTPEVGAVGLSRVEDAVKKFGKEKVDVARWDAKKCDRMVCEGERDDGGFIELVLNVKGASAVIVGATAVSARAGETICELAVCIERQLTTQQVALIVHPYPTYSFAVQQMCSEDATKRFLETSIGSSLKYKC